MKNLFIFSLFPLVFIACGGESSITQIIPITSNCTSDNNTSDYQVLKSGDRISNQISTPPEIKIVHTTDGIKKVCINSGKAVILR